MNKEQFINELKKININISVDTLEKLNKYYNILVDENKKYNLTTITEEEDVYLKHFYDSVLLSLSTDLNNTKTMLDIGCGAGFPGLVIKIFYPWIELTLLDSNNKKTTFCDMLTKKLKLNFKKKR
jgi:16S rRNA (guanine527-N7)-methyltransferase